VSITTTLTVSGMTCNHCVGAVTEELGELPGVTGVSVDLVAGGDSPVVVRSEESLDLDDVRAAVAEAGDYTVTV
jgi:copper chaperone